ncbi:MAG: Crp/Fnr family transcriptional regulator [Clostridia bacterium]|nr:Crp/Fnr family transcriptional regulator [Clostridia bacterium]
MKNNFKIIRKCPLFFQIEDDNLQRMLACLGATVKKYEKNNTVFSEGTPAEYIGIVLSGYVQTVRLDYSGNRSILQNVEPTEVFGEAFACAETKNTPVSVIANEDCEVMLIDCRHILHTCENHCSFHQQLIYNLMKDLATQTVMFDQKLDIASKRSTRDKLISYLTYQARKNESNSFDIPFDRQELADYLEVDRSGLSSEISKLRKEGFLASNKNHFELFV